MLHAAVLELPRSIGLEELKLVICKYTQGALLPGRVFRVRGPYRPLPSAYRWNCFFTSRQLKIR